MMSLTRRNVLGVSMALGAVAILPHRSARAADKVLRVVIHSPLRSIDPFIVNARNTQMHGYMIYDTLFSLDSKRVPQPQMLSSYDISADKKTYSFKLRSDVRFHDGSAVGAEDVIVSLKRWGSKDPLGAMLMSSCELSPIDKSSFRLVLTRRFGMVLEALGKPGTLAPFILPAPIAATPSDKQIEDATGSGPYIFKKDEWVPGSKSVYVRNPNWVPRAEPSDFLAGAKIPRIERVEWVSFPDANVALAALQSGEIDYFEYPPLDFFPIIAKNPDLQVAKVDPWGAQGWIRLNHLQPPFNNVKARQAMNYLVDQAEYMRALGAPEGTYYPHCGGLFLCGTPLETDVGSQHYAKPNPEKAKQFFAEAGYNGEKLVVLHPTDIPDMDVATQVTVQSLRKIGVSVDLQSMAFGTMLGRRQKKDPPDQGGWNIFHSLDFSFNVDTPIANSFLATNCGDAAPGWPCDEEIEKLRREWAEEPDSKARFEIAKHIQERFYEVVPYVSWGQFVRPVATRANIKNIAATFIPVFWNVDKA
jgi:peptide/nickel transport system substrate-binding protein